MKKLAAFLLALLSVFGSHAATVYACACGAGFATGCTAGSQTAPYDTPAKAINTIAQWKTSFQALAAGDHLSTCQGGAFDGVATGNMSNTHGTQQNPVYIDSYDDSARWSGGAGIRPKFNNTSAAAALSFNKGSPAHTEGLVVKDIEVVGDRVNTSHGILIAADTDYVTLDNVKVSGSTSTAVDCIGGSHNTVTSGDGITQHLIIKNSTFTDNKGITLLLPCYDTLVENNSFSLNGSLNTDHDIYMGGDYILDNPSTISSITGDGVTATLTTSTPHGLAIGAHFTIAVTGSTCSGGCTGSFNVTGGLGGTVGTVTGTTTITYPATGTPSATTIGTYSTLRDLDMDQFVIRGNTIADSHRDGTGLCNLAKIIIHGRWDHGTIENNTASESAATPSDNRCSMIEFSTGAYSTPENYEALNNLVIRNNTGLNLSVCIDVDLAARALVENNYCRVTYGSGAFGIRMRAKNFVPNTIGTSTLAATVQSPDKVTIRYNTVYMTAPNNSSWGIALNGNVGDPLTGRNHNLYGNLVVMGSTATGTSVCYNTSNIDVLNWMDRYDYNSCYYLGSTAPAFGNSASTPFQATSSLATLQGLGSNANSTFAQSCGSPPCDPTTSQPFWTSPTTSPATSASSATVGGGVPSVKPGAAWAGKQRVSEPTDRGAYERAASSLLPNSATRIGVVSP